MDLSRPPQTDPGLLVRAAQQEASNLRSELFTARRAAEEHRNAAEQLQRIKQQLEGTVREQQSELNLLSGQLQQLPGLHQHCQQLESMVAALQQENAQLRDAKQKSVEEAARATKACQAAENAKALMEGERSRLSKSRDDLATQLRVAQQRAREAEEEQLRAEAEAAALQAELQVYHTDGGLPATAAAGFSNGASRGPSSELQAQLESERESRLALFDSFQAVKLDLSEKDQALRSAQQELSTLKEVVGGVKQQKVACERELAEVLDKWEESKRDLAAAQQRQQALEMQTQKLKAHVLELQNSLFPSSPRTPSSPAPQPHPPSTSSHPHPGPPSASPFPHTHPSSSHPAGSTTSSTIDAAEASATQDASLDPEAAAALEKQVAALQKKVAMFKSSRDKLLAEVDQQAMELERLGLENRGLQEELGQVRGFSQLWESQAQSSLAKLEQLKDLMEESAQWDNIPLDTPPPSTTHPTPALPPQPPLAFPQGHGPPLPPPPQPGTAPHHGPSGPSTAGSIAANSDCGSDGGWVGVEHRGSSSVGGGGGGAVARQLQAQLVREQARCAKLEVQLRTLCAELLKVQRANVALLKTRVPLIASIETRLAQLHSRAAATS